jgi:hypothetical protein
MKKRVGTEMFVLMSHGLLDILRPVITLSLFFQKKNLDIGSIKVELDICMETLRNLRDGEDPLEKTTHLKIAEEGAEGGRWSANIQRTPHQ